MNKVKLLIHFQSSICI